MFLILCISLIFRQRCWLLALLLLLDESFGQQNYYYSGESTSGPTRPPTRPFVSPTASTTPISTFQYQTRPVTRPTRYAATTPQPTAGTKENLGDQMTLTSKPEHFHFLHKRNDNFPIFWTESKFQSWKIPAKA